jgi:hypothetical protein
LHLAALEVLLAWLAALQPEHQLHLGVVRTQQLVAIQ